jgi:hypothetical protein
VSSSHFLLQVAWILDPHFQIGILEPRFRVFVFVFYFLFYCERSFFVSKGGLGFHRGLLHVQHSSGSCFKDTLQVFAVVQCTIRILTDINCTRCFSSGRNRSLESAKIFFSFGKFTYGTTTATLCSVPQYQVESNFQLYLDGSLMISE